MPPRFLDTNILLRYLTRDDPDRAQRALELLERGEERVVTSPLVVFEVVFTLQKRYRFPKEQIRDAVGDLLTLRGLELPNKRLYVSALELFASKNIPYVDAFNATYMISRGLSEIYTWDSDFDRLEGISRVEP